jgi:hypothetical protein
VEEVVDESGEKVVVLRGEGLRFPAVFDGVDALVSVVEVGLVARFTERGVFGGSYRLTPKDLGKGEE